MNTILIHALIAAARTFADELERGLAAESPASGPPVAGTPRSMLAVLEAVAGINDQQVRGATALEMSEIARSAGMDPRGIAGYYRVDLLQQRNDGTRWISPAGRERLQALRGVQILGSNSALPP